MRRCILALARSASLKAWSLRMNFTPLKKKEKIKTQLKQWSIPCWLYEMMHWGSERTMCESCRRRTLLKRLLLINRHDFVPANQVKSISLHIASYRLSLIRLGWALPAVASKVHLPACTHVTGWLGVRTVRHGIRYPDVSDGPLYVLPSTSPKRTANIYIYICMNVTYINIYIYIYI